MEPTYGKIASAKIHRKPNLGKIGKKVLIVLGLAVLCFIFLPAWVDNDLPAT